MGVTILYSFPYVLEAAGLGNRKEIRRTTSNSEPDVSSMIFSEFYGFSRKAG
jgi:hypothetical protein